MGEERDLLENLRQELRRGTLILSVLSQMKEPKYGYALVQSLEEKGVEIEANTLYPLLRRLEKQGRTVLGDFMYEEMKKQWFAVSETMNGLLREE